MRDFPPHFHLITAAGLIAGMPFIAVQCHATTMPHRRQPAAAPSCHCRATPCLALFARLTCSCLAVLRRLEDGAWRSEADPELICEFFRLLSVCHTVIPERRDDVIEFQVRSWLRRHREHLRILRGSRSLLVIGTVGHQAAGL